MNDADKTKKQLLSELLKLRKRNTELEASETERKAIEETLPESEKRFRDIAEFTPDAIMTANKKGEIIYWNKASENIFGYKANEVLGKSTSILITKHTYDIQKKIIEKYVSTGVSPIGGETIETTGIKKDGSSIPIEVSFSNWEAGNEFYFTAIARDISERIKAQKAISEARDFLESVIESSRDGIVIVNAMGNIISVNSPFEQMSKYTKKELFKKHISELVAEEEDGKENIRQKTKELFKEGATSYEVKIRDKDGGILETECNVSMIKDEKGNFVAGVSIVRDVSERKRMEKQLRQSQKMEAVGTLASGIAHDFNNILAAIVGFTEMSIYHHPDDARLQRDLKQVLKAAYRGESLVDQILAFSRASEKQKKPLKPKFIIKEALKLLRATLPSTIELRCNLECDAAIMADPTQIHQLLMNLCTNAAHAMQEKGGMLEINLSQVFLDFKGAPAYIDLKAGPYLQLIISDTGSGIDPKNINRIFDPFFTTKEVGKGTGMGLSVVHGIVKSNGGDISVKSQSGKGTTFTVLLPSIMEDDKKQTAPLKRLPSGSECVLFIDDEKVLVNIGKKMLGSLGYKVITMTSSTEALEVFRKDPDKFDLVITDQTMPHVTGYELAKQLISIRPDIPVILCTGFSEIVSQEKAEAIGIKEFVMKPINRRELSETVRRALGNKQA